MTVSNVRTWLSAIFLVFATTATPQQVQQTQTASDQLVSAFETVGYEKVDLRGCGVAFARRFEPTERNNGFFAYWRYLDISTIRSLSDARVEVKEFSDGTDFLLTLQYNDAYWERYSQLLSFDRWVASAYPQSNWPYQFPSSHDEYSSLIEYELHQRVDVVGSLNRSIAFGKFGPVSVIERGAFGIASFDTQSLLDLRASLLQYAAENSCI
ncbi:hypothetical protein [Yoonia sp. BS5-3]|uniref:Uncharacterized protein n=1 Tax=Yoonia phaeophyticola TaxID=3137369 RepID=A0ABZ2V1U8_9RHOB